MQTSRAYQPGKSGVVAATCLRNLRGFTLIELLAAIAIVAVLAGLLIMLLGRAREGANAAKCVSNLRQLGILFNQNLQESNYKIPFYAIADYTWINYLDKSTAAIPPSAKLAVCPSALPKTYKDNYSIYGINIDGERIGESYPDPTGPGFVVANTVKLDPRVGSPSRRILLADSLVRGQTRWNRNNQVAYVPISCSPEGTEGLMHFRHTGETANFLFFDGHVQAMKFPDLKKLVAEEYGYTGPLGYIDSQGNECIH